MGGRTSVYRTRISSMLDEENSKHLSLWPKTMTAT